MRTFVVGQRFDERHQSLIEGLQVVGFENGEILMLLALSGLTNRELKEFKSRSLEAAVISEEELIVFLLRMNGIADYADAPFSIRRLPPEEQVLPPSDTLRLNLFLVEASTGIVKGIRLFSFGTSLASRVADLVQRQLDSDYSDERHEQLVQRVQAVPLPLLAERAQRNGPLERSR